MAAIGLDRRQLVRPRDVRATITYISSALANGNPSDAIDLFLKTCPGYEKLVDYFNVLTTSYEIASQIEITDETPGAGETQVEATWSLTLTSRAAAAIGRRTENVKLRLKATKQGKDPGWKIAEFAPIDFFDPQKAN